MKIEKPIMDLPINTVQNGFYSGFSANVTIPAKIIISMLVIWAVTFPEQAGSLLGELNSLILANLSYWYVYVLALFILISLGLAIWPASGKLKLGRPEDTPEFSNFSWYSMMFAAGIGVGMLTWAIAEPVYHFGNNPDVIQGFAEGGSSNNITNAYKWSFLHWGFSGWASFAIIGLAMAYFSYRRGLPLTIRSALTPLLGTKLSGGIGHIIDIIAVTATILGVAQALGFGVEQFVAGLYRLGLGDWLLNEAGTASIPAIIVATFVIMLASTLSALSGVGKGIKWLSNLNMGLSLFLLTFFLIFGSTWFGLNALFNGFVEYLLALPSLMFTVYQTNGTEVSDKLVQWQGGWTIFYNAWWISFAPFVGMFVARISKGRTIREFVFSVIMVPSIMCFIWFTLVGGTAIDLELSGIAQGAISAAPDGDKIFAMTDLMLPTTLAWIMAALIVILLITYLVTSVDSAVLIVNTINAAGNEGPKARPHIVFWGVALAMVVGVLLLAGGLKAIQTAMVISALPFSVIMLLMCAALIKAVYRDTVREKNGVETTH